LIVFVTGATGFIGKHLVTGLVEQGHSVRCLVRRTSNCDPLRDLGVQLVYGDVNDREAIQAGMQGCDWLFHLANLYSMWEPDRSRFVKVNVDGTRNVFDCALACEVKKVVYVSTVAVYGKPAESPFREESAAGPVLFSEYARTKAAAEQMAWEYHHQRGLPLVVFYPGIVLGPGDDKASGQYIQDIIRRRVPSTIYHDSKATYVYVGDLVRMMLRAVNHPAALGKRYLVGNQTLDGKTYARMISEVSGVPLPLIHLPDFVVTAAAYLLTWISTLTRITPLWGLSIDAAHTLKNGFWCDGSKAEFELGIGYTDVRRALREAIESYQAQWAQRRKSPHKSSQMQV
jgi:dihydroflavonol-4-reductase